MANIAFRKYTIVIRFAFIEEKNMRRNKSIQSIFIVVAVFLMIFPLILTFNDALTKIMQRITLYTILQEGLVPFEVKIVGFVVRLFGIAYTPLYDGMLVNTVSVKMHWACLGWQSLLLFAATLIFGLWGKRYTFSSKMQTIFLGIFGLFWINILRISFTVILLVYASPLFRIILHDYLAAVVTLFYLFFFWWFSYSFILEDKT
jgi:exosortase/archaeosortase family protein